MSSKKTAAAKGAPSPVIPGHIPSQIVEIDSIVEAMFNYNTHPSSQVEHLEQSLSDFGQFKNIIIWNGQCIAGNGLLMAARQRGDTHIEVKDYSHLTQQQAEALLIADNATPAGSLPDVGKLEGTLEGLAGLAIPGVTEEWLHGMRVQQQTSGLDMDSFFKESDQPAREKKTSSVVCPECGHEFTP